MLQQKYLIIAEKAENNYAAYSPDVPGCVAAADSLGECIDLMREALFYHFELMAQRGEEIPEDTAGTAVYVNVQVPEVRVPAGRA